MGCPTSREQGVTTVDLLRHGELEGGIRYRGSIEDDLTPVGRAQMDAVWRELAQRVEVIVTSPLRRCLEPVREWAGDAGIPYMVEDRLREMHYGAWEGLSRHEIEERYPGVLAQWRVNPEGIRIPGAEHIEAFADRVKGGWREVLHQHHGRHVLLVAHSGTLRVILAEALKASLPATRQFSMPYASWSRIVQEGDRSLLEYLNRPAMG